MKLVISALLFGVAVASCSVIDREDPQGSPADVSPQEFQERGLISTLSTAYSVISGSKNVSAKAVAGLVADTALTAITGTEEGATLAKTAIGVAGEAVIAASGALAGTALANNTASQAVLNATSATGALLSEYGGGNETVSTAVGLITAVTSGNMSLSQAVAAAGVAALDNTMTPTKEKITIAGKTLEIVGGVVEAVGSTMSDTANSTTESMLTDVIQSLGVEAVLNTTLAVVDSALNITLEDIISEKLAEVDDSTSSLRERVVAAGKVMVTVGGTLVTIGETLEELGDSSVVDYASIITSALNSTTTSSS